jgi:hypothetical protein
MKRPHVGDANRVEDLEDLDDHAPSSEGDDGQQFPPSLWIVVLLLERGRGSFQISASMLHKLLLSNIFLDGFVTF